MKLSKNKIIKKFHYAFAGIIHGLRSDRSIRLQCLIASVVLIGSIFLKLTIYEYCLIVLLCALVIAYEFINSVLEQIVNMVCPEYDIRVKHIKDMAAGSVLVISIAAAVIALLLMGGRL